MSAQVVPTKTMVALTGLTDRRLRQHAADKLFPKPVSGKYELVATLNSLFAYYRKRLDGKAGANDPNLDSEKLRLVREQADKHWLDNQRTKEELVEREKVGKFIAKTFVAIRQKVIASSLTTEEQDEILLDLQSLQKSDWVKASDEPLTI